MSSIENVLNFIVEIDKLKGVLRKTKPIGFERYENSAEHSWHVCISALMLKDYADGEINIDRVIKMLLIHDLCEIDAGDTIIFSAENNIVREKEYRGIKRVLGLLPIEMAEEYEKLWLEFEARESDDSVYAKSIDRIPPILHNLHSDGQSWRENNISESQIMEVSHRIGDGSSDVWSVISSRLRDAFANGILERD